MTDTTSTNSQTGNLVGLPADISLDDILRTIWRRRVLIVLIVGIINALVLFGLSLFPPGYEATSQVLINANRDNVVAVADVVERGPINTPAVLSEIQVLQSRRLAGEVVDRLGLVNNPEFNGTLEPPFLVSIAMMFDGWSGRTVPEWQMPVVSTKTEIDAQGNLVATDVTEENSLMRRGEGGGGLFGMIADFFYYIGMPDPATQQGIRNGVISEFLDNLKVLNTGKTYVLDISVSSESPKLAALAANTVADTYLTMQLDGKLQATQRANRWLAEQVDRLRTDVEEAEQAVETYRADAGLLKGGITTLANSEVSDLNTKYIEARAEASERQARLRQVESLVREPGGYESVPEVLANGLIQNLREQETVVIRKRADLADELGAKHPEMIRVEQEIGQVRAQIRSEVQKVVQGMRNEAEIAKRRAATFKQELDRVKGQVGVLNVAEVKLRALEREAEASRNLFETFLQRSRETNTQGSLQEPDAVIISDAPVPSLPTYPPVILVMAFTFVTSVALGVAGAFLADMFDKRFRSVEQIDRRVRVTPLGISPDLRRVKPADEIVAEPLSAFSESIRRLHSSLQLSTDGAKVPKVIAVTSLMPGEGKTSTAIALARLAARSGANVLLIDFDQRRPSIHEELGGKPSPGVADVLLETEKLEDVTLVDKPSGAHFVNAGKIVKDPVQLFSGDYLQKFLADAAAQYDLVVVDTPPLGAVADALIVGGKVDATVLVAQWNKVFQDEVVWAIRQLRSARANLAGVFITQANMKRQASYGYKDPTTGYRTGSYYRYYRDAKDRGGRT